MFIALRRFRDPGRAARQVEDPRHCVRSGAGKVRSPRFRPGGNRASTWCSATRAFLFVPKGMTPAQIAYWDGAIQRMVQSKEWKDMGTRDYVELDYAGSKESPQRMAAMEQNRSEARSSTLVWPRNDGRHGVIKVSGAISASSPRAVSSLRETPPDRARPLGHVEVSPSHAALRRRSARCRPRRTRP